MTATHGNYQESPHTIFNQSLFSTVAIESRHWLWIVLIAFSVLPLVEIEKLFIRIFKPHDNAG